MFLWLRIRTFWSVNNSWTKLCYLQNWSCSVNCSLCWGLGLYKLSILLFLHSDNFCCFFFSFNIAVFKKNNIISISDDGHKLIFKTKHLLPSEIVGKIDEFCKERDTSVPESDIALTKMSGKPSGKKKKKWAHVNVDFMEFFKRST